MSRSAAPSQRQFNMLVECMEENRSLATGHARTAHARDRTREAWQRIAIKLNSDGQGCYKTWQQWAKYWKDKKAAIKKKVSQIRASRRQTGGGVGVDVALSDYEERVVALLGGESFAVGDVDMQINPFPNQTVDAGPPTSPSHRAQDTEMALECLPENTVVITQQSGSEMSESILQHLPQAYVVGDSASTYVTPSIPEPLPGPSHVAVSAEQQLQQESGEQHIMEERSPRTTPAPRNNAPSVTSSPRRRRLTARRRLLHRSPPTQRQSQMVSLTERFVAIEERRVATENLLARNQAELVEALRSMSLAWSAQSQAIQDLVKIIKDK